MSGTVAPKGYARLEPRSAPRFAIRVFADVIKDLGLRWALNPITRPYKKRVDRSRDVERKAM